MNRHDLFRCIRAARTIEVGIEALDRLLCEADDEKTIIELEEALYNMHRAARCCWTLGARWAHERSVVDKCRGHASDHLDEEVDPDTFKLPLKCAHLPHGAGRHGG